VALDLARDCTFSGPALPAPFVQSDFEKELERHKLLPKTTGADGQALKERWDSYRRRLRELVARGGALRVRNCVVEPLIEALGYTSLEAADAVETREGEEAGGALLVSADGTAKLRVWTTDLNEDLDAPARRGAAYRYSHLRVAQRVLLAAGERLGLLTNGVELRLLICDPARLDSQIEISIDPNWKRSRDVPDSYRLLLALASPGGVEKLPEIIDKARLQQARVTKELRVQARHAVEGFLQGVLDHPENRDQLESHTDRAQLARDLWREALVVVYRLLFVLKLEASDDPAKSFSFASTSLWRNTFSPSTCLAQHVSPVLEGTETGNFLENGLRSLFRLFVEGAQCTELHVAPLGGALFGADTTPLLSGLHWGESAVAHLLDQLLWTSPRRRATARERVHYGPLDVEDLGRVYEALLELEPGITAEPMCRLRRSKLEVVVPLAQGEKYRTGSPLPLGEGQGEGVSDEADHDANDENEEESADKGKKTKVQWIEEIPPGRFYLRAGLGRKTTGSYYTPHSFVRFLVQETLGPQVGERSPKENPQPGEILKLKVLDPAMGSGHFLVEACRFLGEKLYEACRLCDERALAAERRAENAKAAAERDAALQEASDYRQRVLDLPDPNDELVKYLPSRTPEGPETGFAQRKAEALCRRLVAVHCAYGVDKNPLAVGLAKLSLWIESHAEGLPLTFVDHRLVVGDSLTGPFWDKLIFRPGSPQEPIAGLFHQDLDLKLQSTLREAIRYVGRLEAGIGTTLTEMKEKETVKAELDRALLPFRVAAAAWSGGVMLGPEECDDSGYADLLKAISNAAELPERITSERLRNMIARGLGVEEAPADRNGLYSLVQSASCVPALPYDLTFPEVFYPTGVPHGRRGFHAVLSNPPWDRMLPADKEFFASFEFAILDAPTRRERDGIQRRLLADPRVKQTYEDYVARFRGDERALDTLYQYQVAEVHGERTIGKQDAFRAFMERNTQLLTQGGRTGVLVPSAFHANEGATGIRRLYLERNSLQHCYSFENRKQLFEIHRSFKFATVVAQAGEPTQCFDCAFYLHDDEWLFGERSGREPLRYTLEFVRRTGGEYLSLLELRSQRDLDITEVCFANGEPFGQACDRLGIRLGRELNMTDDAWRFTTTAEVLPNGEDPRDADITARLLEMGYAVVLEDDSIHQFTEKWKPAPQYLLSVTHLADKPAWRDALRYFRIMFRRIARSTDSRTIMSAIVPPLRVSASPQPQRSPNATPLCNSLVLLSVCNSLPFDWLARLSITATVNLFILNRIALPISQNSSRCFLAHAGLRLSCTDLSYARLWSQQLGDAWREPKPPLTWPVLATDDDRWEVRAAIDAVVADAYALTRDQYAHVLSSFSHASYRKAPELCLAKFDELHAIGLDAFTKKYDPYWDIPLNENLPQPVIDLPIPAPANRVGEQHELYLAGRANSDASADSPAQADSLDQVPSRKTRGAVRTRRKSNRRSAR
jgi:hypothetical protein